MLKQYLVVEDLFGMLIVIMSLKEEAAERVAINMPIQGSAAELIKIAMIDIHDKIISKGKKSKMIITNT